MYIMNTYLDEKEEHQQEYNDKIRAISTGKTMKIRATKKEVPNEEKVVSDKEHSEIPTSDTIMVTGRLNEKISNIV